MDELKHARAISQSGRHKFDLISLWTMSPRSAKRSLTQDTVVIVSHNRIVSRVGYTCIHVVLIQSMITTEVTTKVTTWFVPALTPSARRPRLAPSLASLFRAVNINKQRRSVSSSKCVEKCQF